MNREDRLFFDELLDKLEFAGQRASLSDDTALYLLADDIHRLADKVSAAIEEHWQSVSEAKKKQREERKEQCAREVSSENSH